MYRINKTKKSSISFIVTVAILVLVTAATIAFANPATATKGDHSSKQLGNENNSLYPTADHRSINHMSFYNSASMLNIIPGSNPDEINNTGSNPDVINNTASGQ